MKISLIKFQQFKIIVNNNFQNFNNMNTSIFFFLIRKFRLKNKEYMPEAMRIDHTYQLWNKNHNILLILTVHEPYVK